MMEVVLGICLAVSVGFNIVIAIMFCRQKNKYKEQIKVAYSEVGKCNSNFIIEYTLEQAEKNKINLGKKDKKVYISYNDETINSFLNDWFGILKIFQAGTIDNEVYQMFLDTYRKKIKKNREEITLPSP